MNRVEPDRACDGKICVGKGKACHSILYRYVFGDALGGGIRTAVNYKEKATHSSDTTVLFLLGNRLSGETRTVPKLTARSKPVSRLVRPDSVSAIIRDSI